MTETNTSTPVVTFEGSPFRLHQPFPPAGDQPEAIRLLVEGVGDGLSFQTLLGVTGSGKTYTMANVIARTGRPALVLAPNKTLAAQLYSEFKEFFPENAVEYFVSYYDYYQPEAYVPSRDLFIEKDSAINDHIEQMRLSATKSLIERRDVVIVATVSCIYGLGSPETYLKMVLHVDRGDKLDQRALLRRLADLVTNALGICLPAPPRPVLRTLAVLVLPGQVQATRLHPLQHLYPALGRRQHGRDFAPARGRG
mgnify:CR=1 FL=1